MKDKKDFRILLLYPNLYMMLVPPTSIALFTGILRREGYVVDLFDTTHYVNDDTSSAEKRVKYLQYRPFSASDLGINPRNTMLEDFITKVNSFKPDLILVSVVEDTFRQALNLLRPIQHLGIPTIIGGVFITAAPEVAISYPDVHMIGLGEGESTVVAVADRVRKGLSCDGIPNLWVKKANGSVVKNPLGRLVDIEKPIPDYSLFDESRFNRPMGGRIFKMIPLETYRGCPYQCTFCNSPMQVKVARENELGNFMRRKQMEQLREEISTLVQRYKPEYIYILDDSFLARPPEEIEAFVEMYSDFRLPFWFNTRPENITPERMAMLKAVGCDRISVGIEHGNEEFRRKVLKRAVSNEKLLRHLDYLADSGIAFSVNNIVGFPGETREMVFETIDLNREIAGYDAMTVSIFTPYHGTELRQVAIDMGYVEPDTLTTHTTASSLLKMPHLTSEQIDGLVRTFMMYVRFPKEYWPRVRVAEEFTEEGEREFLRLTEIYQKLFFSGDQHQRPGPINVDTWEEVFGHMSRTQMR